MSNPSRPVVRIGFAVLGGLLALALATPALGQVKSRVRKAEGKLVAFDAEARTVTVKEKGKKRVYNVKPEGSVLTRTTVSINAAPAKLPDIPQNAPVIVYWVPDEADKKQRFARKIDAPKVPKELMDAWE